MSEPLFSVRHLSKSYPSFIDNEPFHALCDINLDIFEGQCLMLAGSNGSGKTLLMRIVCGLLEPSAGEVFFKGLPLFNAKRSERHAAERLLRGAAGLVFQDADSQIVGETVREDAAFGPENLGFDKEKTAALVTQALSEMGLMEKQNSIARRLSGGEKRRLAIAGVLAMGCSIVIMDEPFANLDWPGIVSTLKVICNLKKTGRTLVILSHELEKALALADRLVIIHRGRLCADGVPEEVLDRLDPAWGVRDPRRNYAKVKDCTWLKE